MPLANHIFAHWLIGLAGDSIRLTIFETWDRRSKPLLLNSAPSTRLAIIQKRTQATAQNTPSEFVCDIRIWLCARVTATRPLQASRVSKYPLQDPTEKSVLEIRLRGH